MSDRLLYVPLEDLAVCSVVKAELFYGALRSKKPTQTLERQQEFLGRFASLSFGDEAVLVCGQIRARLASAGTPLGAYDLHLVISISAFHASNSSLRVDIIDTSICGLIISYRSKVN